VVVLAIMIFCQGLAGISVCREDGSNGIHRSFSANSTIRCISRRCEVGGITAMERQAIPFDRINAEARLALAVQMEFSPLLRIPRASSVRGCSTRFISLMWR